MSLPAPAIPIDDKKILKRLLHTGRWTPSGPGEIPEKTIGPLRTLKAWMEHASKRATRADKGSVPKAFDITTEGPWEGNAPSCGASPTFEAFDALTPEDAAPVVNCAALQEFFVARAHLFGDEGQRRT